MDAGKLDEAVMYRLRRSLPHPDLGAPAQALPAHTAVSLFHFFAWNDFLSPLVYLVSRKDLWLLSVGLKRFNATYDRVPNLIQTRALITLVLPVIIITFFFLAQRVFMQGIVFSRVEK